jgi:hypothetical protein
VPKNATPSEIANAKKEGEEENKVEEEMKEGHEEDEEDEEEEGEAEQEELTPLEVLERKAAEKGTGSGIVVAKPIPAESKSNSQI